MTLLGGSDDIDIQIRLRGAREAAGEARIVEGSITGLGDSSARLGNESIKSSRKVSVLRKGISALATTAKWALLGVVAGAFGVMKVGYDEMAENEKVVAQTNAVLKSTGSVANVSAKHVEELAGSLLQKTGIDDETIQSSENLLLTFTKIRNEAGKGNDVFDRTTKLVQDMSVALKQDAKQSAIQLGKALNDPIKGVANLRRVGVSFTEQQEEQIKALWENGHELKAQKMILRELNKEFGGSAEAVGKTLPGKLNVLKENFRNASSELLKRMLPALISVTKWAGEFLKQLETGEGVGGRTIKILVGTYNVLKDVWEWLENAGIAAYEFVGGIDGVVGAALDVKDIAVGAFEAFMGAVHATVNWITTAAKNVYGFVMALKPVQAVLNVVKVALFLLVTGVKGAIPILKLVGWILGKMWTAAIHVVGGAIKVLWTIIKTFANVFAGVVSVVSHLLRGDFTGAFKAAVGIVSDIWHGLTSVISTVISTVVGEFHDFIGYVRALPGKLASAGAGLFDWVKDTFKGALNWVIEKWNNFHVSLPKVDLGPLGSVGGQTINFPDIPLLAHGGTILREGAAVVGDRGPEILRLPRAARVEPLVSSGPGGFGLHGRSGGETERVVFEVHTHIHLDGKEVAENVTKHSEDEVARR